MKLIASKTRTTSDGINLSTVFSSGNLKDSRKKQVQVFFGAHCFPEIQCCMSDVNQLDTPLDWTMLRWSWISSPWLSVISPSLVHTYSLSNVRLTYSSHYDANHLLCGQLTSAR